jgi:hypothetical protein
MLYAKALVPPISGGTPLQNSALVASRVCRAPPCVEEKPPGKTRIWWYSGIVLTPGLTHYRAGIGGAPNFGNPRFAAEKEGSLNENRSRPCLHML